MILKGKLQGYDEVVNPSPLIIKLSA